MGGALDQRAPYFGVYGQDTWQAKPNLTLNYGLRWEYNPFWHDTENRLIGMVPGKQFCGLSGRAYGHRLSGRSRNS